MFSEREEEIIKIIGKKKMSFEQIAEVLFMFGNVADHPFDKEITVRNSVCRIIKKCEHYKLNWTLGRTKKDKKLLIHKERI
jgi:hypothetical protein